MVFVLFHLFVDVFLKGGHDTYLGGGFTLVLKIYNRKIWGNGTI